MIVTSNASLILFEINMCFFFSVVIIVISANKTAPLKSKTSVKVYF